MSLSNYARRDGHLSQKLARELSQYLRLHPPVTVCEVRAYVLRMYGQVFSRSGMSKLLGRLGFVYKKPKRLPLKADVQAQADFIQSYKDLCRSLLPDESIVFVDAVHPEHQPRPVFGWFHKDSRPALPAHSGRKRMNIHGALDLETFEFQMVEPLTVNGQSTYRLLQKIETAYANKRTVHVFLDNARYHHAKMLQSWLAEKNRRVNLHFLPAYAPHLNPIERLWGVLHKHVTHNRYYQHFNDFAEAILKLFQKTLPDKYRQI